MWPIFPSVPGSQTCPSRLLPTPFRAALDEKGLRGLSRILRPMRPAPGDPRHDLVKIRRVARPRWLGFDLSQGPDRRAFRRRVGVRIADQLFKDLDHFVAIHASLSRGEVFLAPTDPGGLAH